MIKFINKVGLGLKAYLTDWKNLLGHALLGVVFLVLAIWAPIDYRIKLVVIFCLIVFNIIRMRRKSANKAAKETQED